MILRDRDADTDWTAPADGTLEERRYYCQNWRGDVSVILTDTGKMVEWVKYSAYGIASAKPAGDNDSDGDWDATDKGNMTGAYDVRKDADLSGTVGATDVDHANSITGVYQTLGWNTLTSSAVNNRIGYAGYKFAPELAGNKWHVRNRMLDSFNGIWNRFDPLGYVDGMNLYQYVKSMPIEGRDPMGTVTETLCGSQPGQPAAACSNFHSTCQVTNCTVTGPTALFPASCWFAPLPAAPVAAICAAVALPGANVPCPGGTACTILVTVRRVVSGTVTGTFAVGAWPIICSYRYRCTIFFAAVWEIGVCGPVPPPPPPPAVACAAGVAVVASD